MDQKTLNACELQSLPSAKSAANFYEKGHESRLNSKSSKFTAFIFSSEPLLELGKGARMFLDL